MVAPGKHQHTTGTKNTRPFTLRSGEPLSPTLNECILGKAPNRSESGCSFTCLHATLATKLESSPPDKTTTVCVTRRRRRPNIALLCDSAVSPAGGSNYTPTTIATRTRQKGGASEIGASAQPKRERNAREVRKIT